MRSAAAALAGLLVGALGAVILGEYALDGWLAPAAGVLLGLLVGEVAVSVARKATNLHTVAAAAGAGGGMVWALWISTGHRLGDVGAWGWAAVVLAAASAGVRARPTGPAPGTRPATEPSRSRSG